MKGAGCALMCIGVCFSECVCARLCLTVRGVCEYACADGRS